VKPRASIALPGDVFVWIYDLPSQVLSIVGARCVLYLCKSKKSVSAISISIIPSDGGSVAFDTQPSSGRILKWKMCALVEPLLITHIAN